MPQPLVPLSHGRKQDSTGTKETDVTIETRPRAGFRGNIRGFFFYCDGCGSVGWPTDIDQAERERDAHRDACDLCAD